MRLNPERAGVVAGAVAAAVLAALSVTTSGRAATETAAPTQTPASDASYNAAFNKSTHDSCLKAATSHGAASDAAERYCGCVVGELGKLTAQQKENLTPSSPELQSAQKTCQPQLGH